ncbi:MAG: hypothetical protein J7647_12555 [Cyanobacteria bacterium SBLK]|nr:hypothetical protein [Cyanobacteria bacterium SBLK]
MTEEKTIWIVTANSPENEIASSEESTGEKGLKLKETSDRIAQSVCISASTLKQNMSEFIDKDIRNSDRSFNNNPKMRSLLKLLIK